MRRRRYDQGGARSGSYFLFRFDSLGVADGPGSPFQSPVGFLVAHLGSGGRGDLVHDLVALASGDQPGKSIMFVPAGAVIPCRLFFAPLEVGKQYII